MSRLPDPRTLHALTTGENRKTHAQLAEEFGVSRSAISQSLIRAGLADEPIRYTEIIPWRVRIEHQKHYLLKMLRLLGRDESGHKPLRPEEQREQRTWKSQMDENNWVVAYRPDRGFALLPARPCDKPGYTWLTDAQIQKRRGALMRA